MIVRVPGIRATLGALTSRFPNSPLRHFHYDVFETPTDKLNRLERTKIMFITNLNGDMSSLSIPFEPVVKDIVFGRAADRSMKEKSFLEVLAGQYELGSTTITVLLREDNSLLLVVPGQTPYELLPVRGTYFDLKGLSGYCVEFKKDVAGKISQLAFYQPDGNYVAKRK